MTRLVRRPGNEWLVFNADMNVYQLGSIELAKSTLLFIGVEYSEYRIALESMLANNHNVAEFGIQHMFVYSTSEGDESKVA